METKIGKSDWLFLLLCLLLGILAEEAFFFGGEIGISYFIFIAAFYSVFFWRYRHYPFSHQRLGYLVLMCIWLLSAGYFINNSQLFYVLNLLVIPGLVIFHLVLVTSPKSWQWNRPVFLSYLLSRLVDSVKYNAAFTMIFGKIFNQGVDQNKSLLWKKIFIGILISVPVLAVVLNLLMSADSQFDRLIGGIPQWFRVINAVSVFRIIIILIYTFAFFGFMQTLLHKQLKANQTNINFNIPQIDSIISLTVLVIINAVYILFTIVQFKYFFSGTLQGDFTYAQYARKGFFELLFVTLINLSITVLVLTFVERVTGVLKRLTQFMLTILVLSSAIMLFSAFLRMGMYEEAYGFTFLRVLVHSFMIFLCIIFAYTLVKIWVEKLSLFHFYFIASLIYYSAITVIDLDKIVVKENINRFETSGKIDLHYLNNLSYSGVLGLIDLYEKNPHVMDLKGILLLRKEEALKVYRPWQSYNWKKAQAYEKLRKLDF
ncbi:DUF4153 domain-containing protein [Neobacillus ginsengisoli]|uniref:DUF4173 domain-containing protein n=1 Tax=Neobacillus ginsengisoli TaxID=904295 RepID=A0ABT9XWP9_9BACI|nr:DUF4173 domain-containing protein [Neobacillus ginsengisoli]MDQ0199756.1 hypothetical protein [Neobacillus ginsengisoli]